MGMRNAGDMARYAQRSGEYGKLGKFAVADHLDVRTVRLFMLSVKCSQMPKAKSAWSRILISSRRLDSTGMCPTDLSIR